MIEHRGEPLAELARLGVDAALLAGEADGAMLDEARAARLAVVAQPRPLEELESVRAAAVDQSPTFSDRFESVLAWRLGGELASDQLGMIDQWAAAVRRLDGRRMRPLIAAPLESHRSYSRAVDTLLLGRRSPVLADTLHTHYQREMAAVRLAGPGSSHWSLIPTQEPTGAANHSTEASQSLPLRLAHVRRMLRLSLAAGAGGVVFTTSDRQDSRGPGRLRAARDRKAAVQ